jgi:enoyl-CoA hydratase/carnithine racemase
LDESTRRNPAEFLRAATGRQDYRMGLVDVSTPAEGVRMIQLNRPDQLNALNAEMSTELRVALDEVEADEDCRVVVLTGAGRGFCAGLDLNGYGDDVRLARQGDARGTFVRQREIAGLAQRLHHLRQPVIAAVNGAAAGGGLALVLASDIRIAADRAVFAVSFIRAGYSACDIGTSWLLPRIVGAGRAHELMLTGRRFDAAEALRIGLLTDVVDETDLISAALAKAAEIQLNPPFSVELTKQGMWISLETPGFDASVEFENRQQIITAMTADQREAAEAFLAKRPPRFGNR